MEYDSPGVKIIKIVLIFLAIAFFILLIIWIFRPGSPDSVTEETATEEVVPDQYGTVRYVQEGEITAPEEHNTIVITISNNSRRIEVFRGYNTGPKRSESFANSDASYDAFYAAIKASGFFNEREASGNYSRDGYCPLGVRYDYQAGTDINMPNYNTWSASCSSKAGSFAGSKGTVKTLFKKQIPEYSNITKGVKL